MRIPIWMVALGVVGIAATGVGCSGGGDDDDDDDGGSGLQTGTYTFGSTTVVSDECDTGVTAADYDGSELEVTSVTATTVTFAGSQGPIPLPRSGDTIGGEEQVVFEADYVVDFADYGLSQSYNCVEEDLATTTLTITNDTTMAYNDFTTYTAVSGSAADCIAANASAFSLAITAWPCETEINSTLTHN